jgi:hypothetical protein
MVSNTGWTCGLCGAFIPNGWFHECPTSQQIIGEETYVRATPVETKPIRYRVKGRIERDSAAPGYLVDLTFEAIP